MPLSSKHGHEPKHDEADHVATDDNKQPEHQSPINLAKDITVHDKRLKATALIVDYHVGDADYVEITDEGFRCVMKPKAKSKILGLHLDRTADYRLWQIHMHWGETPKNGSEHAIDGKFYAGEIHCVFWNSKLGTRDEAMHHADGFTVLAAFMNEVPDDNPHLTPLIDAIDEAVESKDCKASMPDGFDLGKVLPERHTYYTYGGSLTTEPYAECVQWTILYRHVGISSRQLDVVRRITSRNVRPLQELHGRTVRSSFHLVHKTKH